MEVASRGPIIYIVEPDRVQHAGALRVEVTGMKLITLATPFGEQARQVESHDPILHAGGGRLVIETRKRRARCG
jgi:hypothetical protein